MAEPKPKKWPQYLATFTATIGAFALGTTFNWTSPASAPLRDGSYLDGVKVSLTEESWVGALMPVGAAFACFPVGFLLDYLGRKTTMLLLTLPMICGWILCAWPNGVLMLFIGRFLVGIAGGCFTIAIPVYTAEIAEDDVRGALGGYFEVFVVLGVLFVYALGTLVSLFTLTIICGIIPIIFVATFIFMPETPTYYVYKGRLEDAKKSLRFLRGKDFEIDTELKTIEELVQKSTKTKQSLVKSFSSRAAKKGLLISLSLMIFQQMCGINIISFYTSSIFENAHSNLDPNIASLVIGFVEFCGAVASTLVVDRWGRRILLLISGTFMALCLIIIGVYFFLQEHGTVLTSVSWLPVFSLAVYIFVFELGFGPIPWMIVGELFLPHIQGPASSVSVFVNWTFTFLVTKFYSNLLDAVGGGITFWIFAICTLVAVVFVYFIVVETKGKSINEIQDELMKKKMTKSTSEIIHQT